MKEVYYRNLELDALVIMPNHIHGVLVLVDSVGAGLRPAPTPTPTPIKPLSEIVRALKSFSARHINQLRGISGVPVWQRNYYERIIRDEGELNATREYILNNPLGWDTDSENPNHS